MKDLQAIINKRAEDKLLEDFKANPISFFYNVSYKDFVEEFPASKYDWKLDSMLSISNSGGQWIYKKVKEKLLDIRIEKETALFLKEIEDLKFRTQQLQDDVSNLNS